MNTTNVDFSRMKDDLTQRAGMLAFVKRFGNETKSPQETLDFLCHSGLATDSSNAEQVIEAMRNRTFVYGTGLLGRERRFQLVKNLDEHGHPGYKINKWKGTDYGTDMG